MVEKKGDERISRKVIGDPSQGVRVKASRDWPGKYFLIEAKQNRRVYNGYHTKAECEAIIKRQGWKNLGEVGQRPAVAEAVDKVVKEVKSKASKPREALAS